MKESKGIFTSKYVNQQVKNIKTQKESLKTSQILPQHKIQPTQNLQNKKYQYLSPHIQYLLNTHHKTNQNFVAQPYQTINSNVIYSSNNVNQTMLAGSRFRPSPVKSQVLGPYIVRQGFDYTRFPNQMKTIIHAPVPIIHPIIYQQQHQIIRDSQRIYNNHQNHETIIQKKQQGIQEQNQKLKLQVNMIMEQYEKLYKKYEQLQKRPAQVIQKIVKINTNENNYDENRRKIIINKQSEQISYIFQQMQKTMNARLQKIYEDRLRQGLNGIKKIKQESLRMIDINFY